MNYLGKMIGLAIGLAFLSAAVLWHNAAAFSENEKTSYDVYTLPVMYLNSGIDKTQTVPTTSTSIQIAAPKLNGSSITPNAMSGAIFEFRLGSKKEDIYSSRITVDANNIMTLSGTVIRDLCQYTETGSFTGCNSGQIFPRGAEIRLSNNHRLFNLSLYEDRPNVMQGSGSIICAETGQPCLFPGQFTTAQRDALTFTNNSDFHVFFNSTLGTAQYYNPTTDSFIDFGSGAVTNATTTTAGSVEIATTADHQNGTVSGDSGAFTAVVTSNLTMTGGLAHIGKVPVLNDIGVLPTYLGGTGTGQLSMSGILLTNGSGAFKPLYPGSENDVIQVDSNGEFVSQALTLDYNSQYVVSSNSSAISGTDQKEMFSTASGHVQIGTGTLAAGDRIVVQGTMSTTVNTSEVSNLELFFDSTEIVNMEFTDDGTAASTQDAYFECTTTIVSTTSVRTFCNYLTSNLSVITPGHVEDGSSNVTVSNTDTTGPHINLGMDYQTSTSNSTTLHNYTVDLIKAP